MNLISLYHNLHYVNVYKNYLYYIYSKKAHIILTNINTMPSKFQEMLRTQRLNDETSRAGLKWEQDEDDQLMRMISDGVTHTDIAKTLSRSEGSIKTRLILFGINKMEKDGLTIEDAASTVNLTDKDLTEYLERKALREDRRHNKTASGSRHQSTVSNADIYDLLMKINKKLDSRS